MQYHQIPIRSIGINYDLMGIQYTGKVTRGLSN